MTSVRPRYLIVNADDLGLSNGVNQGIWDAAQRGIVTSASLMMNTPGTADAVDRLRSDPTVLDPGLHINLTAGTPLTECPTLTDPRTGRFLSLPRLVARAMVGYIDARDVIREVTAQLRAALDARIALSHIDSHQHVHLLRPIWDVVITVAAQCGVHAIRIPHEPVFGTYDTPQSWATKLALRTSLGGRRTHRPVSFRGTIRASEPRRYLDALLHTIDTQPLGYTELMVHPGYADADLAMLDRYTHGRAHEVAALTSRAVRERIAVTNTQLATFSSITRDAVFTETRRGNRQRSI